MSNAVLQTIDLRKTYTQAGKDLDVLKGIALDIKAGEIVALVGPSGAGKSTLLQQVGLLEKPTSGQVLIAGQDAGRLNDRERTRIRRHDIGFVYQFHHLLPEFSALENIIVPQMIAEVPKAQAKEKALSLLNDMGLTDRASHRPARMSGGEQQRVAIARALANQPRLLLADEPTGNLDEHTAESVFSILTKLVKEQNIGALIATHNLELARKMDRILEIRDGQLSQIT